MLGWGEKTPMTIYGSMRGDKNGVARNNASAKVVKQKSKKTDKEAPP